MRFKVCFNRGTQDAQQAWVVEEYRDDGELSGVQHVAAGFRLNGAQATGVFAPQECPSGYLIVTGRLKRSGDFIEFEGNTLIAVTS